MGLQRLKQATGLLLFIALIAVKGHTQDAVNVKEGSVSSTVAAQQQDTQQYGADQHHYQHRGGDNGYTPGGLYDEYDNDSPQQSTEALWAYGGPYHRQAHNPADRVGQTYLISTHRRTLSRPASTTVRQLAKATPPEDLTAARNNSAAQQLKSLRRSELVRRHTRPGSSPQPTAAPKGKVQLEHPRVPGDAAASTSSYGRPTAKAVLSFDSLNAFDTRYANGGNQYDSGVPDQALCVGNGYVLAAVNTVLHVYDAHSGQPKLVNPLDLNTFYGYPAEYNSTADTAGPVFVTDPVCAYDKHTQRWFLVELLLQLSPDGLTGITSLEIAVSDGPDPTGSWSYYSIPGTNNGNEGTPDFGCSSGFCFPDFPQIAVWRHALVITANVFDISDFGFNSVAVYAVDKVGLIAGATKANTALVWANTAITDLFTLIPATQVGHCSTSNTYLMATLYGSGSTLQLLSLEGTETLASQHAHVTLYWVNREVALGISYSFPPAATQKPGDIPLGNDLNITTVNMLDPADARMASVTFVDDKLYCAWGTAVQDEANNNVVGVAWALVDPHAPQHALDASLLGATASNHLLFPYLVVRPGGSGVMAVTISGPDFYPSAAYATLTRDGLGQLTQVAAGLGPLDDFTGYFSPDRVSRFGDYAAATVDEHGDFWIASEYVAQTCTLEHFLQKTPVVGVCGKTRTYATNWGTRITKVRMDP